MKVRFGLYYQSLDSRRSAPGAADPKNFDVDTAATADDEVDDDNADDDAVDVACCAAGSESTRCAFIVLMAISSFLRGPNAVILSSVRFSGVSDRNISMSTSLTTKVPIWSHISSLIQ